MATKAELLEQLSRNFLTPQYIVTALRISFRQIVIPVTTELQARRVSAYFRHRPRAFHYPRRLHNDPRRHVDASWILDEASQETPSTYYVTFALYRDRLRFILPCTAEDPRSVLLAIKQRHTPPSRVRREEKPPGGRYDTEYFWLPTYSGGDPDHVLTAIDGWLGT